MNRLCPVLAAARARPEEVALLSGDQRWTWRELHQRVSGAAAALAEQGVRPGDRLAARAWNSPELVWLFFAASRLGAALVPFNMRLAEPEVAALLARVGARFVFGDLPGALPFPVGRLDTEGDALLSDACVVAGLFTSGTTGGPKLVELTHGNLRAAAEANGQRLGGEAEQRWLGTLPLFHVGGLAMLYRCAVYGASLQLEAHFDAANAVAAMDAGVTHVSFVPTMLERVLDARGDRPFRGVKAALIGGGPMTAATLARARAAGLPVLQTYGLTEACSQVTTELPSEADGTTAGPALAGVEVRIVGADVSGVGEIEVRGPTVAKGLGPWLQTKDLGSLDERGRLKVFARRMDLILSGGENVYPAEVEAVLREHPQILDVAVLGRADAQWGQVPVALVVSNTLDPTALMAWARDRLATFKVPRAWIQVEALPRNATGKLDRAALRTLAGL